MPNFLGRQPCREQAAGVHAVPRVPPHLWALHPQVLLVDGIKLERGQNPSLCPPPSSSQLSSRVPGCPNKIDPSGPTPPAWGPRATAASKFGVSVLNCGILMDFFFFQHTCERLFVFAGPGACQLLGCDGELPASFQQPSHSPPPLLCPIPGGWWETGHCQGWPLWAHSAPAMCQGSHCLPQLDS